MLICFSIFCSTLTADIGVGGLLGFDFGTKSGSFEAATVRWDTNPWCFSANFYPFKNKFSATSDNWFINEKFSGILDYYCFWGISAMLGFSDNFDLTTGARIGAGLDWFVLDKRELEFFVQGAWNPYLGFGIGNDFDLIFVPLNFPISTGARWWFR